MKSKNTGGFTLIEVLVGIAVTGLLLAAVFQFIAKMTTFRMSAYERGVKVHHDVALQQLMHRDLMSIPVGEMQLKTGRNKFSRRTVSYETPQGKVMDANVEYTVKLEDGKEKLFRKWQWSDIHDSYQKRELLLSSDEIVLQYRSKDGQWLDQMVPSQRPEAVRIQWDERTVSVPVASSSRQL